MIPLKLLLVEDDDKVVRDYQEVLKAYIKEHERPIQMHVVKNLTDAIRNLDGSIDAAIVDLNLGNDTSDGGKVIEEVKKHFRIPVVVLTATPADAENEPPVVGIYTKGEHPFRQVLDRLWDIFEVGLTKIMGGRGLLEERLNNVFLRNLLPTLDVWIGYAQQDNERTRKALLRYALGHLAADLDADDTPCYPEEVYLAPPLENSLQTGALVRHKQENTCHIVMTPACDLVLRANGTPKTDVVVVAEVVPEDSLFESLNADAGRQNRLKRNNDSYCFHWLPAAHGVSGGFVDFRRLRTVRWDEFDGDFDHLDARVAPSFVKDIVSRFSTFYARQGQPAID